MLGSTKFSQVKAYVEEVMGQELHHFACREVHLPVHIQYAFEFACVRLGSMELVLAFARSTVDVTPLSAKKQSLVIGQAFGLPVVFILPNLPAWARRRFVEQRTAFITPQRQLFLPDAGLDYRDRVRKRISPQEHQDGALKQKATRFTPSEQQVLLFMLLQPGAEFHAAGLVNSLGVSQMTVSRAFRTLEERGLIARPSTGRERPAQLRQPKEKIWTAAQQFLQDPVRHVLVLPEHEVPFLDAGLTSLAGSTNLVAPPYRIVAASTKAWKKWSTEERLKPLEKSTAEPGDLLVQVWTYAPEPLSSTNAVDPLSLHLSFRSSTDERVAAAIDELLGAMQWKQ